MTPDLTDDTLDELAREYDKRPKGAPSFFDLQTAIRRVRREDGALVVDFDLATGAAVEELAAAERRCCPTIGFAVTHTPAPTLRITATAAELDIFQHFRTG
jgi:hypothetical protein